MQAPRLAPPRRGPPRHARAADRPVLTSRSAVAVASLRNSAHAAPAAKAASPATSLTEAAAKAKAVLAKPQVIKNGG